MGEVQVSTDEMNHQEVLLTEEELLQKHKVERKELQASIQKLKKNVNNCKKKKKEVAEEVARLESDLSSKHQEELQELKSKTTSDKLADQVAAEVSHLSVDDVTPHASTNNQEAGKVSRAARRRAKKAETAAQRELEVQQEREQAILYGPRGVEAKAMANLLQRRGLAVTEVTPDGDCMYAALSLQLGGSPDAQQLRQQTADYLMAHEADFLPFLTDLQTGDALEPDAFEQYCHTVATTHTWGGQPELRALSESLKRKIEVLQAVGTPIILGEEFPGPPLLLAYYRHRYTLGEHYNSLAPASANGRDEEEDS